MIRPETLGQLLLMQSYVISLPDEKSIFSFVCHGLHDIPGVAEVRYVETIQEQVDESIVRFPLLLGETCRGELLVTVLDSELFTPYADYLKNFCFMLAVILEERSQRQKNELFRAELEARVQHRTAQLQMEINERIAVEESLRESEERYRNTSIQLTKTVQELRESYSFNQSIIDSSSDCIKLLDLKGRLQYMSPGGQLKLGIKNMDEFLNISYEDFWKDKNRDAALEAISKAQHGHQGSFEGYCPTLDGTPKWWEVIITPVRGSDGNPEKLLAVSRDITNRKSMENALHLQTMQLEEELAERQMVQETLQDQTAILEEEIVEHRRTEEALKKSERRLNEAERIGGSGSWDYNVATDKAVWSENMFRIFDVDPSVPNELVFEHFVKNKVHPDDVEHLLSVFKDAVSGRRPYDVEYRIVLNNGQIKNIHAIAESVYDEQGKVIRLIGKVEDITERLRIEETLRLTRFSVEHASDGVFWMTPDARIIDVNEAACRSLGYTRNELLKLTIPDIDPFYNKDVWKQHFIDLRQQGSLTFETIHTSKEGIQFPVEIVANYVQFGSEECNCAFVRNISDRKLAEQERIKLESQLHQAQKMESVGSLAGGVAHDFNNKLSVILGCTYMAFTEEDPAKTKDLLDDIRKAAEQSADLTRQLLAFARKQTIAPKVLDLNETVTSMLKMLNRLIGEDISLTWQPAHDLWLLKLDPSQVDQILANLCVNARDSIANDGKIVIETGNCFIDEDYCAGHADAKPGAYVRLVVSDNGSGMDSETLNRIFEPFFTTKETGKGTGLGLATVFGIVKQNNGFINVYSEPGIGTTFTIYLPRYVSESVQNQKASIAMSAPVGLETILLVEDELAILKMASLILGKQGYTVLSANTPAEAIRLAKETAEEINLLITDVIMPGMNGKDLSQELQLLYPKLKCLFMSGYTADSIAQHGVLDEGVNFIQKPFSLPALATKVREVLDQ